MSKNADLWSNLLFDEDLSDQLGKLNQSQDNRGVEAYRNSENHRFMKNDNAKKRKKNRIRPYQKNKDREDDLDKEELILKGKNTKKDINANRENRKDIPDLKVGVKRILKKKREISELDSVEDVAEEIRFRLWEKKRHMIRDLVKTIGIPIAIEIMDTVTEIECQGGEKRHNGGRKTPGGVFCSLAKKHEHVDMNKVEEVLAEHTPRWQNKKSQNKTQRAAETNLKNELDEFKRQIEDQNLSKGESSSIVKPLFEAMI